MAEILVRDFVPGDAAACVSIFERAWHAGHAYAPRRIDASVFEAETKDETLVVAEHAGTIVGFASVYRPQSFIHHLYVDPDFARQGIGSALLERSVVLSGGRASLKCQTRNAAALAFYRRLGWIEVAAGVGEFGAWVAMRSPG